MMSDAAEELNSATGLLNEYLARAEKVLVEMRLGVSARVDLEPDAALVFMRCGNAGNTWALYLALSRNGEAVQQQLLLKAGRRYRVLAAKKLRELREMLLDHASHCLEDIEDASDAVESFLNEFENRAV